MTVTTQGTLRGASSWARHFTCIVIPLITCEAGFEAEPKNSYWTSQSHTTSDRRSQDADSDAQLWVVVKAVSNQFVSQMCIFQLLTWLLLISFFCFPLIQIFLALSRADKHSVSWLQPGSFNFHWESRAWLFSPKSFRPSSVDIGKYKYWCNPSSKCMTMQCSLFWNHRKDATYWLLNLVPR